VCLKDRLKVECEAVPERELSTSRAREHAPGFWRPLSRVEKVDLEIKQDAQGRREENWTSRDDVHRTSDFVR
jgi:hypothetical protein